MFIQRFGEDLLEEAILILYKKIKSYDLDYRDNKGNPTPVKFISYIWKRIDGSILDTLKKELNESNYYDRYSGYALRNGDLSSMSGLRESSITHCSTMSYINTPRDINPRGALSPNVYDS
ncbi:MAG: hypothetical protein Q7J37_04110 [Candidatus Omnitrophota bacterium]|nr:hypothetical protein [Candidatus Omnitrophota bacterium]